MNLTSSIVLHAGGPGSGRKPKPFSESDPKTKAAVRSDPRQVSLYGPGHTKELQQIYKDKAVDAAELTRTEMEGIPEEDGSKYGKKIVKEGTQFCIVSNNPQDGSFGCYPSREKAENVMHGKSFIIDDLDKAQEISAGGPGSGRHKEEAKAEYDRSFKLAKELGYSKDKAHELATQFYLDILKRSSIDAQGTGNMPQTGWQYGKRTLPVGYVPQRTLQGFPSGKGGGRGGLPKAKPMGTPKPVHKAPRMARTAKIAQAPQGHKPNASMTGKKGFKHHFTLESSKKIKSFADLGEPMAGALGHAHLETKLWFHPPSLTKRKKADYVPTDDPGEKDNRFLDVTKRNSKDTKDQRMKRLKRSSPGGMPQLIPVHTTLLEPHQAVYMPGMNSAGIRTRPARDLDDKRIRVGWSRQGCL